MRLQIFALLFLFHPLLAPAKAQDSIFLYLECSPGQTCMNLADENGKTESVLATPAQVLGRAEVESASVQKGGNTPPALNLVLSKEASSRLEKITAENIGKRLMVVVDNKILTAPTINSPVAGGKIMIGSKRNDLFWEKIPWLKNLISESYRSSGRPVIIYTIIALGALVSAFAFVLWPRIRKTHPSSPE